MKLDLACGQNKHADFTGVDIAPGEQVDIVWDLEVYPWQPFADNSVEEIVCNHYIEHVGDLMKFMNEIHRICKDGAKITFTAPYYTSIRAWQDPTHKRAISEATFYYFTKEWRSINKLDHYPITCDFALKQMLVFFEPPWDKKSEEARAFAQKHYWNVVSDILVELEVVK